MLLHDPPGRFLLPGSSVQRHAMQFEAYRPPAARLLPTRRPGRPTRGWRERPLQNPIPQRENMLLAQALWRAGRLRRRGFCRRGEDLPHGPAQALTRVSVVDGVAFWNDSKATNFHAVEAALAGFPGTGCPDSRGPVEGRGLGRLRGQGGAPARPCRPHRRDRPVPRGRRSSSRAFPTLDLRQPLDLEAVRLAASAAQPSGVVLLSPGFASFDMFRNYEERGNQFE